MAYLRGSSDGTVWLQRRPQKFFDRGTNRLFLVLKKPTLFQKQNILEIIIDRHLIIKGGGNLLTAPTCPHCDRVAFLAPTVK